LQDDTQSSENAFLQFIVENRTDGQQPKKIRKPEQRLLDEFSKVIASKDTRWLGHEKNFS
jgi:hypothetical protein